MAKWKDDPEPSTPPPPPLVDGFRKFIPTAMNWDSTFAGGYVSVEVNNRYGPIISIYGAGRPYIYRRFDTFEDALACFNRTTFFHDHHDYMKDYDPCHPQCNSDRYPHDRPNIPDDADYCHPTWAEPNYDLDWREPEQGAVPVPWGQ